VHDFGSGDILEVKPQAGGRTLLLPFADAFVPSLDIAGRRIVVVPPADSEADAPDGG
jgi:16S rRNA processing protein RimM